jgi:hypothetical protein
VSDETLVGWYKKMIEIKQMDNILYEAQRQVGAENTAAGRRNPRSPRAPAGPHLVLHDEHG